MLNNSQKLTPLHMLNSEAIRGFNNIDHEEETLPGIGGSHDTVMILMRDKLTGD